jgi:hypothetical protein
LSYAVSTASILEPALNPLAINRDQLDQPRFETGSLYKKTFSQKDTVFAPAPQAIPAPP